MHLILIPKTEWLYPEYGNRKGLIKPFQISRCLITQDEWRLVSQLPSEMRKLDPDPSYIKGGDRPVECVSWDEAVEFCARLTTYYKEDYGLPSINEWKCAQSQIHHHDNDRFEEWCSNFHPDDLTRYSISGHIIDQVFTHTRWKQRGFRVVKNNKIGGEHIAELFLTP